MRNSDRGNLQTRVIKIQNDFFEYAEGSALIEFGKTKVACSCSFNEGVPKFLKGSNKGWLTAEYSMLPRATHTRNNRDISKLKINGRTQEIQRLIGRSLRAAIDLSKLGENTLTIDCDVLQADGGTRTAAITGGFVALSNCINTLMHKKKLKSNPIKNMVAAISVGMKNNKTLVDLDYLEDYSADIDFNVVMLNNGEFIEVQGTAEKKSFSHKQLNDMLEAANSQIEKVFSIQQYEINKKKY